MPSNVDHGRALHDAVLKVIEGLMMIEDPSTDSSLGALLDKLSTALEAYEIATLPPPFGTAASDASGGTTTPVSTTERASADSVGPGCNPHPDAPHGFARNASHSEGRYVCECEGWEGGGEAATVEGLMDLVAQYTKVYCDSIINETNDSEVAKRWEAVESYASRLAAQADAPRPDKTNIALLLNRLILMAGAKATQPPGMPDDERITDAEIDALEAQILYAASPSQAGGEVRALTDEQIDAITDAQWGKGCKPNQYLAHRAYARAIEAEVRLSQLAGDKQ